jgi:pyruvate formate lyase activating enzyme
VEDLLADLGELSLPVKVDSNGSAPDVLEHLLASNLAQTLAVDVKGPWELYPELTGGMSAARARECLHAVFDLADAYPGRVYFRCTKVPRLSAADLNRTRAQVPEHLPLVFQKFVPPAKNETY